MDITRKDHVLGVNYRLVEYPSAKTLAKLLKDTYEKKGIDIERFNSKNWVIDYQKKYYPKVDNINEVYEYQNFFLLHEGADFLLLDGFRRLLWYDAPDIPIQVRVYDRNDLTDEQLLQLIVYLNHFKFYASQKYYDRGFQLFLKTIFDIDISKIHYEFEAYMVSDTLKQDYSGGRRRGSTEEQNEKVKDRIVDKFFLPNIRFLIQLKERNDTMVNKFFASLLYQKTQEFDRTYDPDEFIKEVIGSPIHKKLFDSWRKVGNGTGARAQKTINALQDFYTNTFDKLSGLEVEKTLAEVTEDVRNIALKLRKDKSLTKIQSRMKNLHHLEKELLEDFQKGKQRKYKMVVYPLDLDLTDNEGAIPYGLIENCEIIETVNIRSHFHLRDEIVIGFWIDKEEGRWVKVWHTYGDRYSTYGNKYARASLQGDGLLRNPTRKVELFLVNE